MNRLHELKEKWLADELSPTERHELHDIAVHDEELALMVAEFEQQDKNLALLRLGPKAPFDMAKATLRRIQEEQATIRPARIGFLNGLFSRQWTWSVPAFAGVACVLVFAGAMLGRMSTEAPQTPRVDHNSAASETPSAVSVEQHVANEHPGTVRFVLRADRAASVVIVGDFNDWNDSAHPLQRSKNSDLWTTTLPLKKGMYEYMFIVDGTQWITDPLATRFRDDGFGNKNAVLEL